MALLFFSSTSQDMELKVSAVNSMLVSARQHKSLCLVDVRHLWTPNVQAIHHQESCRYVLHLGPALLEDDWRGQR